LFSPILYQQIRYFGYPQSRVTTIKYRSWLVRNQVRAHQYQLKGSVVEGGVMDGNATMAVFYLKVGEAAGSASSGCSK
ncbi:hypothetical protein BAE44_0009931, partial [Dichanthelium oligosanthes]